MRERESGEDRIPNRREVCVSWSCLCQLGGVGEFFSFYQCLTPQEQPFFAARPHNNDGQRGATSG